MTCLHRDFYDRPSATVARQLLGKVLWRQTVEGTCSGRIVEVEAYEGTKDSASHSYRGQTPRNASMFGPPGHAYVYAIHSRWCVNVVTEGVGIATAILIRAVEPLSGLPLMTRRRSEVLRERRARSATRLRPTEPPLLGADPSESVLIEPIDLCRGPARLCEAFAITHAQDGLDLTLGRDLWIEEDPTFPLAARRIVRSPRIGISSAQERLLRFFIRDNRFVSGKRNFE